MVFKHAVVLSGSTSYLTSQECTLSSLWRRPLVRLYIRTDPLLVPDKRQKAMKKDKQ